MKGERMIGKPGLTAFGIVGMMAPFLIGCIPGEAGSETVSLEDVVSNSPVNAGIPQGAMPVSDGIFAVPIAVDADGCEQFSQWSESGVTQPVILYRDGDGGFTAVKSDAASCNADMVETNENDQGCPTYRAEQPDGKITDVVYYPSNSGFTANPDRAVCDG